MAKILIYGNPRSPLVRIRGLIGRENGHKIFWVSAEKANISGVKAFGLPSPISRSWVLRVFFEPFLIWRTIRQVRPDIVHVHYASKGLSAIPLIGKIPLVVTVMGSDIMTEAGYRGPYAFFTRILLNRADFITSKSDYMDKRLKSIGSYQNKIIRITWGVNLNVFKPKRDRDKLRHNWRILPGSLIFFEPRNAIRFYNKHVVIEAFAKYKKKAQRDSILLLATGQADRRYLNELREQIRESGLEDSIRLLEPLSEVEMSDAYCLSDVTITAPVSDGLPHSLFEAMACGSYLLLGDLPQYSEIVKNCGGVRTAVVGDPNSMAKQMLWLSNHFIEMESGRKQNLEFARRYADFRKQSQNVLRLYTKILAKDIPH